MGPVAIIAGIGLGVAAYGTAKSISAQKKAARAQKKQFAYQRSMDNLRSARERKEAIRAARISSGAILQAGVNQGAENTSAALGGLGSIQSQVNQSLSFLDQMNVLSDQAGIQAGKVASATTNANIYGQVANLGMTVWKNAEDISGAVFGPPKKK